MIRYLLDSSALWRVLRDAALRAAWADVIAGRGPYDTPPADDQ